MKMIAAKEILLQHLILGERDEDEVTASRSGRFTSEERTSRCPLKRRLGGPQSRSGRWRIEKALLPSRQTCL
jgi:hypothetical protein